MNMTNSSKLLALLASMAVSGIANAGITFYTDRPTWESAAGVASFTEDFSGFASDTEFRTAAIALNGMSIWQEGSGTFRNTVDFPPLEYTPNSGSTSGSLFTNAPESPDPGAQVRIAFDLLNLAFGFDSWDANSGEGALLEVYDGMTLLGSQALTNLSGAFLGYLLDGGDTATSVRFVSNNLIAGGGGEGFYIDNLAGVAASSVPEPATLALLGLGVAGLGFMRRKA